MNKVKDVQRKGKAQTVNEGYIPFLLAALASGENQSKTPLARSF